MLYYCTDMGILSKMYNLIEDIYIDTKERFLKFVEKCDSGCHEWRSTIKTSGYGQFWNKKPETAHRVAYKLFKGDIPEKKLVLHTCDNKICVNPEHLYAGTHKDNAKDMHKRANKPLGRSKLSRVQVVEIRERYKARGITQTQLAKEYGVQQTAISRAILGQTYQSKQ